MHEQRIERSPAVSARDRASRPNISPEHIALSDDRDLAEAFLVEGNLEPLALDVVTGRERSAETHPIRHVAKSLLENEPDARLHACRERVDESRSQARREVDAGRTKPATIRFPRDRLCLP